MTQGGVIQNQQEVELLHAGNPSAWADVRKAA